MSLVPKAANQKKFIITKAVNDLPKEKLQSYFESIKKQLPDEMQSKIEDVLNDDTKDLDDDVLELLVQLLEMKNDDNNGNKQSPKNKEPNNKNNQSANNEPNNNNNPMEKEIFKQVNAEVQTELKRLFKEKEDIRKELEKQKDYMLEKEYIEKCKNEYSNLPLDVDDVAIMLKSMYKISPSVTKQMEKVLSECNTQMEQTNIMKEIGGNGSSNTVQNMSKIDKAAELMKQNDPTLSHSQAITKALEVNPELYNDYLDNF